MDVDGFVAYPDNCDVASLNSSGVVKCTTCEERYTLSTDGDSCKGKYMKHTNKLMCIGHGYPYIGILRNMPHAKRNAVNEA